MSTDNTGSQSTFKPTTVPDGKLAIIPLKSMQEFGRQVDKYLIDWRRERVLEGSVTNTNGYARSSFIVKADTPRFGSGEAKGTVSESIRGEDIYILVDVMNYNITYQMNGFENVMSPDDHFADVKRIIGAIGNKAHRINVIMPYLYEGRRIKQSGRESLDCANMLQELTTLGVENIITFDAHDARVQNAVPLAGFESFSPTYQFIKNVLRCDPELKIDNEHLLAISPDEGGMRRAIYLANVLGIDMGMFYTRRDYSTLVDGSNPILSTDYLGPSIEGKDIIVIDDMISSGNAVLSTAKLLKEKGARKIFICATFGILTNGTARFDEAYRQGLFNKLITTNLVYQPEELLSAEYYISCDMSKYIALIIDTLNHDDSLSGLLDPIDRIHRVMDAYNKGEQV